MTDMTPADIKSAVDAVLASRRLPVGADEYERLLRTYPSILEMLAELHAPEMRYLEPAVIYRP
jgi:hypothetical protein